MGVSGIVALPNNLITVDGCKNYGHILKTGNGGNGSNVVCLGGVVGWAMVPGVIVTNCENFGTIEQGEGSIPSKSHFGGVVGLTTKGTSAEVCNTITSCKNHGTVKFSGSASAEITLAGVVAMPTAYTTITNCENTNTGVVWMAGTCSSNNDIGGVVGGPNATTIDITYCTNNGAVKQTKKNSGQNYIGGVIGYAYTWNKISHCTNNGPIETVGSSGRNYVGGVVGYARHLSGPSEISNCVNTYPLVFTGDGGVSGNNGGGYWAGGVIACATFELATAEFVMKNLYNVADLTFEGRATAGELRIGGIVGHSRYTVRDSYCYGNIKAIGKEGYIGLVMGTTRMFDENAGKGYISKAVNCKVGGKLIWLSEERADEETGENIHVELPGAINADNWYKHIYPAEVTEAVAKGDGCDWLSEKPATPVYTYTPAN